MAPPSAQTLQRLANETGYQPGTLEKVLRLLDLLREGDPILSERLVLKGGTALNVFHLGLDRLSVDIDLNYIGALDRAELERERPAVENVIDRLLASQGYGIRRRPSEHAGGKWLSRYASALGGNATLELDMNYMMRQPLFGATRMASCPLGNIRADGVLVLDLHEVVAGKIVALVDRRAARDLFDARRILSIKSLNWRWIKAAVLAMGAGGRRDWRTVSVDAIDGNSREFRQKLASAARPLCRYGRRRGSRRLSRSVGRSSPSCSTCRRTNGRFSTAFLTMGRSTPTCLMSNPRYKHELMPCQCWRGSH